MRSRCTNPNTISYKYYGALGVSVCARWDNFEIFLADILATIGERPPGHSLDRYPDINGNYELGNVRWATVKEQNSNKRPYKKYSHQRPFENRLRDPKGRFVRS
jgi:hypothetical protein